MALITQDVHKSWQRFKIGLAIFVAGAVMLLSISHWHIAVHYLSLSVLFGGFAYAMFGYAGIFLNRFTFLKNKKPPPKF
ncbi:hypothetical protein [Alteromonas sp. S167]|uniref:hypothetical protein n=1 Tax=Alteromonas sp. S167 TaxID=3117402 RepID=UPI002FE3E6E4